MADLRVAVVGGGIGGLTAVLALLRAGHQVTCFEQAADPDELGAGIQLGPNATRLLHRLGLTDALTRVAVTPARIQFRRGRTGTVIKELTSHPDVEASYGAPYYTIHRADLRRALAEALPADTVHLGARCTDVTQDGSGATLTFADGTTHRTDIVIGADGLRSQLRQTLDPTRPRFSGKASWRVLVPATAVPDLAGPATVRMWLGPGQHLVSYPVRGGSLLSLSAAIPANLPDTESWTREGPVDEFIAAVRGWDPDLHRILAAAEKTLRLPLFDRPPLPHPGEGRLTLLGDAAHPMLPFFAQGAAQAIEDAWILARSLENATPTDAPEALRRYEQARRGRVSTVQQRSTRNGMLFQLPDGLRQRGRDLVLRRFTLKRFDWLYGYDPDLRQR